MIPDRIADRFGPRAAILPHPAMFVSEVLLMAVPKKKMSRSRTRRRKAHWKVASPTLATCQQCGAMHVPHRVCAECGSYNGRIVTEV